MFNKTTNVNHETRVVAITKVIEKTISPDKVTEMYDAVKEEVENNLIKSYRVTSNQLSGIVCVFRENHDLAEYKYVTHYTLNGKDYITKGFMPSFQSKASPGILFEKLFDSFKEEVAKELFRNTVQVVAIKENK